MILPRFITPSVHELLKYYPIVSVTGPRQSGKTTLLKFLFPKYDYVSLENPDDRLYAEKDPIAFLEEYSRNTIIDEAQRVPHLFSYLQTKVDEEKKMGQYILSGSQNFLMRKNISQSLAGRVGILRLLPLTIQELTKAGIEERSLNETIFTGFYPRLFEANLPSTIFYQNYIDTYLQRDVQELVKPENLTQFLQFLKLCAGHAGQLINYSALSNSMGITLETVKNWLSILEQSYIIFRLTPYFKNFNKRLVKKPKLYFYDVGLACHLLGMKSPDNVDSYYQKGALFENLVIADIAKSDFHDGNKPNLYFWRDSNGNEMDLLRDDFNTPKLLEIKSTKTLMPHHFKSVAKFQKLFQNESADFFMAYGGDKPMVRSSGVKVLSWRNLSEF